MDSHRIAALTRTMTRLPSRRDVLRGLGAAGIGWGVARLPVTAEAKDASQRELDRNPGVADAATNTRQEARTVLCTRNGSPCRTQGDNCRSQFCLNARFTITAKWTEDADHDAYLFVPRENATTGPSPYIDRFCTPGAQPLCDKLYPFVCHTGDASPSGPEVITVHQLVQGRYEYWIQLWRIAPHAALTIVLKDSDCRAVRKWTAPASQVLQERVWHVFDFNGDTGRVTSIDELLPFEPGIFMPDTAYSPNTDVCPD